MRINLIKIYNTNYKLFNLSTLYHKNKKTENKTYVAAILYIGRITAAATTGPARQPLPASSQPATICLEGRDEVYFKDTPEYKGKVLRRHGDELERLENGYYRALGRVDDAMNLGGIKVSSVQIEEVIGQLDFIKESAAVAVSPKGGGPSDLVICYVEENNELDENERLQLARNIIRKKLNPLFKVARLYKTDLLPRTASGKVMHRRLRDLFESDQ